MTLVSIEEIGQVRVVVCVPTFARPKELAACLASIARQKLSNSRYAVVEVLVADNAPDGDALRFVKSVEADYPFKIAAIHVPDRGLCNVRNALFAEARVRADLIALIDDDEEAMEGWLDSLLSAAKIHDADAVVGPVFPRHDEGAPRWYLLARADHMHPGLMLVPTGSPSPKRATHNTLISVRLLDALSYPWFPPELNFAGSEDRAFFDRAKRLGFGNVIWCAEARVEEFVPMSRMTPHFFLKRCLQRGSSEVAAERIVAREFPQGFRRWVVPWLKTIAVIFKATLMMPLVPLPRFRYRAAKTLLYGFGRVKGHLGAAQELYR